MFHLVCFIEYSDQGLWPCDPSAVWRFDEWNIDPNFEFENTNRVHKNVINF
jgi:hypothetical protein